jgi:hypothetical protein
VRKLLSIARFYKTASKGLATGQWEKSSKMFAQRSTQQFDKKYQNFETKSSKHSLIFINTF